MLKFQILLSLSMLSAMNTLNFCQIFQSALNFVMSRVSLHADANAFCFLSRARIAIHGATWIHSRISTRMYLRCNTYTRVKGGYAFAGARHAGRRVLESVAGVHWPSSCQLRPFVRGRAISPDRPPMGVVPSSNRDYGLRRGRCSPRAPRTRILYLPEKSSGSPDAHVCASTVCPERIGSLPPRQLERSAALLLADNIYLKDTVAINEGKDTFLTDSVLYKFFFVLEKNFRTPRSVRNIHLETCHQPQEAEILQLTRHAVSLMFLQFFLFWIFDELTDF